MPKAKKLRATTYQIKYAGEEWGDYDDTVEIQGSHLDAATEFLHNRNLLLDHRARNGRVLCIRAVGRETVKTYAVEPTMLTKWKIDAVVL